MVDANLNPGTYVASVLNFDEPLDVAAAIDTFNCEFKCKPSADLKRYKPDDVIDDERSVRWNREEIARRNKEYDDEVSRLKDVKANSLEDMKDHLLRILRSEYDLKMNEVKIIWEYAYEGSHYGYKDVLYTFEEVARLYARLKDVD